MIDTVTYDPHAPKKATDLVGNSERWSNTADLIRTNRAMHFVLVGPAGCGKSCFLRLALADRPTLMIDCTANSGLRDVRDTIRTFARGSRSATGDHRWVWFEHADALTADTQAFLRRMLETTSGSTRFVFECRDAGAISEPILSRSTIVTVHAPEYTEQVYELLRRTNFTVPKERVEAIVRTSHGNMRSAILNVLAVAAVKDDDICTHDAIIQGLLEKRPTAGAGAGAATASAEWIRWAIETEQECRIHAIDLRDILRMGWPSSPIVSNTCAIWSRLGGTSARTLFFDCISQLISSAA
jgi:replication factor C small subunit